MKNEVIERRRAWSGAALTASAGLALALLPGLAFAQDVATEAATTVAAAIEAPTPSIASKVFYIFI